jgi:hypothetical protein
MGDKNMRLFTTLVVALAAFAGHVVQAAPAKK